VQLETTNAPVEPDNWDNVYSVYLSDQWRLSQRLTFNLGVRYDYQHSFVPEQTRPEGPFAVAETFPFAEVGRWHRVAPRLAAAWDVIGGGRTVAKATYGVFNSEAGIAANYNRYRTYQTVYRWTDPNRNGRFDRGEVDLDTNGPDFISTTSAANNRINENLKLSNVTEVTASVEHELMPALAVRGLYVLKHVGSDYNTINVLRPYSAFNIPIERRDPGPDGVLNTGDDGGLVTIYDYDPLFRGSNFVGNQEVNRPDGRNDYYNSYEASITRRMTRSWSMLAAYTATKYHRYLVGIPQSPNEEHFDLDEEWRWAFKLNGNYTLPYDVSVGGIVEVRNGVIGQRTYVFRATDASGAPLRQLASATIRMEPFGSRREGKQTTFNLRVSKMLQLPKGRTNLSFDVLNVLNTNAITAVTYASGPSFGRVTDILPPRTIRFGVIYDF